MYKRKNHLIEAELCKLIVEYVTLWQLKNSNNNLIFHHSPNEGVRTPQHFLQLKRIGMRTGYPDFVFSTPNSTIFIEVKTKSGSLTKAQKIFEIEALAKQFPFYVVTTFEEFEQVFSKHFGNL